MIEPDGLIILFLLCGKSWHGKYGLLSLWLITKDSMSKNIPDFGGFPTDNSSMINLKYDIIASKLMTGI